MRESTPPWFTRATLREELSAEDIARHLMGQDGAQRNNAPASTGHRLIWRLFSDHPGRKRDFLWRETRPGEFFILSAREPVPDDALLDVATPLTFEPHLERGDLLEFSLRANPIARRLNPDRSKRSAKHDVVMDALHKLPAEGRAAARRTTVTTAGAAWLARQGARGGFHAIAERLRVDGYEQHRLPRPQGAPMRFATLEVDGVLEVIDPQAFLAKVRGGMGGARAFGCGLMLIRRYHSG